MARVRWNNIAVEEEHMKTAYVLGMLVLSFSCWCITAYAEDNLEPGAIAAAETWLRHVDAGEYAGSWREASAYFQGAITEKTWVESLNGVRTPLGKRLSRQFKQGHRIKVMPGAPDGDYVVMQFDTRFEQKQAAVETVTFLKEKNGTWKAAGYHIK